MSITTLRIDLVDIDPPVWRMLRVPSDLPLLTLHRVIQLAMGWEDSHLHGFARGEGFWRAPQTWVAHPEHEREVAEARATLSDLLTASGDVATYMYDFGDDWEHRLRVVEIAPGELTHVELTDGAGASPPEDSGGVPGHEELLETLYALRRGEEVTGWPLERFELMLGPGTLAEHERQLLEPDLDLPRGTFAMASVENLKSMDAPAGFGAPAGFDAPDGFGAPAGTLDPRTAPEVPPLRPAVHAVLRESLLRGSSATLQLVDAAQLADVPPLDDDECRTLMEPVRWYLDLIGEGRQLTAAGYLRPADTEAAAARLITQRDWPGRHNREIQTLPLLAFRHILMRMRLLRKYGDRLLPVKSTASARVDDRVLTEHIADTFLAIGDDFERECTILLLLELLAHEPAPDAADTVVGSRPSRGLLTAATDGLGWNNPSRQLMDADVRGAALEARSFLAIIGALDRSRGRGRDESLTSSGRRLAALILQDQQA